MENFDLCTKNNMGYKNIYESKKTGPMGFD